MIKLKQGDHAAAIEMIDDTLSLAEQMTMTARLMAGALPADPRAADHCAAAAAWHAANP